LSVLAAVLCSIALPGVALAQAAYPERPVKLIIPYAPGGVYDAVGRPWAEKMSATFGTLVVENRGGGGGSLGAAAGAAAPPDGYTLLLGGAGPHVVNPLTAGTRLYDPIKDFEPIALLAKGSFAIVVHPSLPAANLAELIAHAKSNPGKLSYATAGVGSGNHLTGELLKSLAKLPDIAHVPYKGAGPALADVVGGHVPLGTLSVNGQILSMHRSGQVRVLAISGPKRVATAPDIPAAQETVPGLVSENFIMLFAPKGTPKAIIERVRAASAQTLAPEDLHKVYAAAGWEAVRESDPEQAGKFLKAEIARWAPLVQSIGLKK
jgi:tripartite-type tricarboxylate transporter receptor subunit TctC